MPIAASSSARSPNTHPRQSIPFVVNGSPAGSWESRPVLSPHNRTQSSLRLHSPIIERREHSGSESPSRGDSAAELDHEAANEDKTSHGPDESAYLHSKLWWTGFALMNVGEIGNFLSYAYAPASLVAPLGAVALISNCFFAPLILHERFRTQDLLGIALSIFGAVTVVYASQSSSPRLDPDTLIRYLTRIPFLVWATLNIVAIILLSGISSQRTKLERAGWVHGDRWALVDVGLCALFGGFTVLSTKAVSSLLSAEWAKVFTEWIFYPAILILALTGVGQIRHLNRALHHHESRVVIPTQFVLFNLTAIVGSAILYRDFDKINFHRFLTFFYGCMTTFLGVYLLTRGSNTADEPAASTSSPTRTHRTPTQATPLLAKPTISPRSPSVVAKRVAHRASVGSLNVVGLSPGPYLLLATPAGSPGVVAVPIRDDILDQTRASGERRERSTSRSTVRGW
ncbi:Magnesium transporter NIPA [Ceratobasidium sp. AG-Ba]|nr:Magnesium transporter NIPA [Ceratobasidium sp. AG-Ba]QRW02117.1 Magnesium transporter NIPA [Ceratobasidium sp. AG-Ba]